MKGSEIDTRKKYIFYDKERKRSEKYLMEGETDEERNEKNVTTMTVTFYDPRKKERKKNEMCFFSPFS